MKRTSLWAMREREVIMVRRRGEGAEGCWIGGWRGP